MKINFKNSIFIASSLLIVVLLSSAISPVAVPMPPTQQSPMPLRPSPTPPPPRVTPPPSRVPPPTTYTQIQTPPSALPTTPPSVKPAQVHYDEILDFWFGPLRTPEDFPTDKANQWISVSPELERSIHSLFEEDVQKAQNGGLNEWRQTPKGRLALILLLHQFPRYLYRDKPQAYLADRMAQGLVIEGLQKGDDKKLYPIERAFFYLPLQHAEDINLQNLSVNYYQRLVDESPEIIRPQMEAFLRSASLHQQIIAKFGRFPYRNYVLGRESTPEELIYLNQQKVLPY